MKKFLILLILTFLFYPQADAYGVKKTMEKIMEGWIGENIETVIQYWGLPDEVKEVTNKKVYYWYNNGTMRTPAHATSHVNNYGSYSTIDTTIYGGNTIGLSCTRMLGVDEYGFVNYWQWKGNNCPMVLAGGYQHWPWMNPAYAKQLKLQKQAKRYKKVKAEKYDN